MHKDQMHCVCSTCPQEAFFKVKIEKKKEKENTKQRCVYRCENNVVSLLAMISYLY